MLWIPEGVRERAMMVRMQVHQGKVWMGGVVWASEGAAVFALVFLRVW